MTGPLADVINCAKFYLNWVRGFDSVGVGFLIPHRKEKSPLTQGLNYRSACDKHLVWWPALEGIFNITRYAHYILLTYYLIYLLIEATGMMTGELTAMHSGSRWLLTHQAMKHADTVKHRIIELASAQWHIHADSKFAKF